MLINTSLDDTMREAAAIRDRHWGHRLTYSRKVFIPLTKLCRDVCHYCTFAKAPRAVDAPYLSLDDVVAIARAGAAQGCKEALFTLGDRPEDRYAAASGALATMGFASTLDYLATAARRVVEETGLIPHLNPGLMDADDYRRLRDVSGSMGIMLESSAARLTEKGQPHHGSPDKDPTRRLASIAAAGAAGVPFTSGLLIGIGETRSERIDALMALADMHATHGHLQEVIIQNFRPKPGTRMAHVPEPDESELLWSIAAARILLDPAISVQAPPNLNPQRITKLVAAGINDWGGISPVTIDHVNPDDPWPDIDILDARCVDLGYALTERLTIYPGHAANPERWIAPAMRGMIQRHSDAEGLARDHGWAPGQSEPAPVAATRLPRSPVGKVRHLGLDRILARAGAGDTLTSSDIIALFATRGDAAREVMMAADALRRSTNGDDVTYVVNRNINYTNICSYACSFCAFSKTSSKGGLRDRPYRLDLEEIACRAGEALDNGATEVCLQGGIHPAYDGHTYLDIVRAVKAAYPALHIHAFSPLEVAHGAETLSLPVDRYLGMLRDAGLGSLPGTAAEILSDDMRAILCPDKLTTAQWLDVVGAAHRVGLATTATIMFGHVETTAHWAEHLLAIRRQQFATGGFTEFVPLPFVHMQSPIFVRGLARPGPTWRETLLMHAVARLALHGAITNIQASWVKLGNDGVAACLDAGVNDLGGTLMNESISRAAGASHGQLLDVAALERIARSRGRTARERTTLYRAVHGGGLGAPLTFMRACDDAVARGSQRPATDFPEHASLIRQLGC